MVVAALATWSSQGNLFNNENSWTHLKSIEAKILDFDLELFCLVLCSTLMSVHIWEPLANTTGTPMLGSIGDLWKVPTESCVIGENVSEMLILSIGLKNWSELVKRREEKVEVGMN